MEKALPLLVLAAAVGVGCGISGYATTESPPPTYATTDQPELVAADNGVWVVRDADQPTYYSETDNYYYSYRGGSWYRSPSYGGGWVIIDFNVVPGAIARSDHGRYRHYHGGPGVAVRRAPPPNYAHPPYPAPGTYGPNGYGGGPPPEHHHHHHRR